MAASWEASLSAAAKLRRAATAAKAGTLDVEDAREALRSAKHNLHLMDADNTTLKSALDYLLACSKAARPSSGLDSVLQQLTPEIAGCLPSVIGHLASQQHQEQAVAIFIHYSRAVQSLTGVLGILSKFGFCSEDDSTVLASLYCARQLLKAAQLARPPLALDSQAVVAGLTACMQHDNDAVAIEAGRVSTALSRIDPKFYQRIAEGDATGEQSAEPDISLPYASSPGSPAAKPRVQRPPPHSPRGDSGPMEVSPIRVATAASSVPQQHSALSSAPLLLPPFDQLHLLPAMPPGTQPSPSRMSC